MAELCERCGGTGKVEPMGPQGIVRCPVCGGTGYPFLVRARICRARAKP